MNCCIPKRRLPPRNNLPWLKKELIGLMMERNAAYKQGKRLGDFIRYKRIRNKVTSELRKAKKHFFRSINLHNPKEFWRAVKYLTKNQHTIPYLIDHDGSEAHSSQEKASLLNSYFAKCFNTRTASLDKVHHNFPLSDDSFTDLY